MANSSTPTVLVSRFLNFSNKWFLYTLLLIWPFGHFLKIGPIFLLDIFAFLVFLTYFADHNHRIGPKPLLTKLLYFYWFTLLASIFVNFRQQAIMNLSDNFLYYLRAFSYPFIALSYQKQYTNDLKKITLFSVLLFCFFSLSQYLILPDLRIFKNLGFDDHYYRLAGTLLDPNFAGAIFAILSIYFILKKRYFLLVLGLVSLSLTFSRASYLSFLLTLPFMLFKITKKQLLVLVSILLALVIIAPKPFGEGVNLLRTYSIVSRVESISNGFSIFLQKPLFGHGFGLISDQLGHKISIDNSYVYILAGSGVLGMLGLLGLFYGLLCTIPFVNFLPMLPVLIHSLFNNSFYYIWIATLFWVLVGEGLRGSKSA